MIRKGLSTAVMITVMGASSITLAQPGPPDQHARSGQPPRMQQPGLEGGHRTPPGHEQRQAQHGPQPHQDWHQGSRMPESYRDDRYIVSNWRQHDLSPPAKDQRWMSVNGDYVLIAVATGVSASIVTGHR